MEKQETEPVFRNKHGIAVPKPVGIPAISRRGAYLMIVRPEDGHLLMFVVRDTDGVLFFPGGGIEDHETPEEAALRETREEVGKRAVITDPTPRRLGVDHFTHSHRFYASDATLFIAKLDATRPCLDEPDPDEEVGQVLWVNPATVDLAKVHRIFRPLIAERQRRLKDEACCGIELHSLERARRNA